MWDITSYHELYAKLIDMIENHDEV
jgi:hypothetical protein